MKPYYDDGSCVIYHGDALDVLDELTVLYGRSSCWQRVRAWFANWRTYRRYGKP
jgi:UDP-2,3-diacylglucosamine pyrophosphatase LpxH